MESSKKHLLTPLAGAIAAALTPAQQAIAQNDEGDVALEEVIVTATKRNVSVQDISASVQAITAEALSAMGAKGMEDYGRFIPSMSAISYGAGATTIVFRGAATGQGYIAQSTSSLYLDEMSITTTGSQPGVRMVDIERVEALAGPQGTLYGSDAQAGTLRIITNKPKMDAFEGIVDLELRGGADSDASYRASGVLNFPLIEDTLALRLVAFADHDGGYIDNVYGHTPDTSNFGPEYPSGFGTLDNERNLEKRWNESDITGARLMLAWAINEDWNLTATGLTQMNESGATSDMDPFVGDLKTVRFLNDTTEDDYQMYSLTVNGDLGFAQLVGAVNYYEREINANEDITAYAHYWAAYYGYCQTTEYLGVDYPYYFADPVTGYVAWYPVYCGGEGVESDFFSAYWQPTQQDKFTTEVRLSSQGDIGDWIIGFYYEESNDSWQAPFALPNNGGDKTVGADNTYQNSASLAFWEWYFSNYYGSPATYPEATSHWYEESSTDWEQKALFGEYTWHINDAWDLTLGGRYFKRTNTNSHFVDHPGDLGRNGEPDIATPDIREYRLANDGRPPERTATESEFIPKVSLSWKLTEDQMLYALYTQGKRPGGINRSRGDPFFPNNYFADLMDNYEMGYRSMFAGGKGRFNTTLYHMVWTDYQIELVDPASGACEDEDVSEIPHVCGQPWQNVVANAGKAHITGINFEVDYAFDQNWKIGGNLEFMEAETDSTIDLDGDGDDDVVAGLRLPISPRQKGSFWLDYVTNVDWFGGSEFFSRLQASYTGNSVNILAPRPLDTPNPQFTTPSYTIADISVGVRGRDWEVTLFLNNLTDERAIYTIGSGLMEWGAASAQDGRDHVQRAYVNRPRELGLRFSKRWGG